MFMFKTNMHFKKNAITDKLKALSVFLLSFLLLASPLSKADDTSYAVNFTPTLQRAYFEIQKLRIEPARQLIDEARAKNKNNAAIAYLDNYADLHYLMISEDKQAFQTLLKQEEKRLEVISDLPDSSPYKKFLLAEIRVHWAFAKIKFGSQVGGAWEVIKAYRLLEENKKKFPNFYPTYKTLGLLHILIGSVPDQYQWVTKILGLKGSVSLGLSEINTVVAKEPFFRQEAELINILIHAYTLKVTPSLLNRLREIIKDQPDNLLFHFFATTTLMKEGKSEEALTYLNDAPRGPSYIPFTFLEYLKGEIMLQKGQYELAEKSYKLFLNQYKGFNYIKDANLKLFMCNWLDNQDAQAVGYITQIEKKGATVLEADQFAQRVAEDYKKGKLKPSQKVLFKARYSTDGGYLDEAWEYISKYNESDFQTISEKTELNYRKGRILQKKGRTTQAIPLYNRALTLADGSSAGFAASAALQCGYIYMAQNDKDKAVTYFKKAVSFKNHEYKNSVDNKAQAALTELGK